MQKFSGSPKFGLPIFECTKLGEAEKWHLSKIDYVLTTSEWAASVLEKEIPRDRALLPVVGGGVDTDFFKPAPQARILDTEIIRVLAVLKTYADAPIALNIGKLETRKGHFDIIEVLRTYNKSLSLVCVWHNHFQPKWLATSTNMLRSAGFLEEEERVFRKNDTRIAFVPWITRKSDLLGLIQRCDFGLYPYRSEGWCLPLIETMACGKPVIATNYSGPTQYLSEECGVLLNDFTMTEMYEPIFFTARDYGEWAVPSHDSIRAAVDTMRDTALREKCGAAAREQAMLFNWERQAEKITTIEY